MPTATTLWRFLVYAIFTPLSFMPALKIGTADGAEAPWLAQTVNKIAPKGVPPQELGESERQDPDLQRLAPILTTIAIEEGSSTS
ncbi:hypothetical protein SCAR479_00003 [Seiridium cardinale]|uniref:Uncharacterized protein n=1 Tax=Seiridium cardinale TaxID=138064 RepID=A0ABR2Y8A6_9PEZI